MPTATNPLGVKGAGEAGCVGALPAVMIAVMNALKPLGVGQLDMPATERARVARHPRGADEVSRLPARRRGHGRTAGFVRDPQRQAVAIFDRVDAEFGVVE